MLIAVAIVLVVAQHRSRPHQTGPLFNLMTWEKLTGPILLKSVLPFLFLGIQ